MIDCGKGYGSGFVWRPGVVITNHHVAEGGSLMGLAHQVDPIAGELGTRLIDHRVAGDHEGVGFIVVLELAAGYVHGAVMGLQHQRRAGRRLCMGVRRGEYARRRDRKRHQQ